MSPVKASSPTPADWSTRSSIRERLIVAGEHLVGDFGIEGVSLRQVGVQAGTRNNNAVQYHFKDLGGLIRAVVAKRTPEIEAAREAALAKMDASREDATRALLEAFFTPLLGMVDSEGQPRFARFMLALHRAPDGWRPLDDLFYMMPATERILDLLNQANPAIPAPVIWQRLRPISVMLLTYTCSAAHLALPTPVRSDILEGLIDMAVAALRVPLRESLTSKFYGFVF